MKAAKVTAVLSAGCVIAGIILLACTEYGYRKGRQEYALLQEKYISRTAGTEDADGAVSGTTGLSTGRTSGEEENSVLPADAPQPSAPDWNGLLKESGDIVGWVELPAVGISYPVLQGEDNEFYLHHDIRGEYLFAGSIFLDSESSPSFRNLNTVIYGHNMRDGSMFARLKEYADSTVWEESPYFWIYTPEASILYRIGSVHTADASGSTYLIRFPNSRTYTDWLEQMLECSALETCTQWTEDDRIVTLSTCTGQEGQRWVVQGAKAAELGAQKKKEIE